MNTLTYLSNAGVVLDLDGVTLMIDGLYDAQNLPFSDVPTGVLEDNPADYLAFTHTHHDHLDPHKLEDYLATHPVKGLLLPPRVRGDRHGVPEIVMKGTGGVLECPGITIRWARTPHLDRARPEHHSFLVRGGGVSLLVAGDAMPSPELGRLIAGEALDAALVTPLFLQEAAGRALLAAGKTRRIFLYHLPRREDDAHGLLRLAERQVERWGEDLCVAPLLTPGARLEL